MNWFDKKLVSVFPKWAVSRMRNKAIANSMVMAYEATKPSRFRKKRGSVISAESSAGEATEGLRSLARELDENHDIASGILDILVNNIIGTGINVEPQIKDVDGKLLIDLNKKVSRNIEAWNESPEVTGEFKYFGSQRMSCRSWMRDGEMFVQKVSGLVRGLTYESGIPFYIELIEADLVPTDLYDKDKNVRYGIKRNTWGRATLYYMYKDHPGDTDTYRFTGVRDYKKVKAEKIIHLKNTKRIRQGRGITVFATVFNRLDDIRDMSENENIAGRVAAAQVIAITKSLDSHGLPPDDRLLPISPGTVWDNLMPGEEPKILSSDRPNNNLGSYTSDQLKYVASGTMTGHSSVSKTFDKSFAAQRQENIEQVGNYKVLQNFFIDHWCKPIHDELMKMMFMTPGLLEIPNNIDMLTISDADFVPPVAPWVDPEKAMKAEALALKLRIKSQSQVIRERGGNPQDVREQIAKDNEADTELDLDPVNFDNTSNMDNEQVTE